MKLKAEVIDEVEQKQRVWDLFKSYPEPYGYNPALFFPTAQRTRSSPSSS